MVKKYLIPHHGNGYRPHFFKGGHIAFLFIFCAAIFISSQYAIRHVGEWNLATAIAPDFLIDLANKDRASAGQSDLVENPKLAEAARLKAEDMASKEYFAHNSPEGLTPWHWFAAVDYNFAYAGENLAVNFSDSEPLQKAWMDSPLHRANILNGQFTEIGIGVARGTYKGKQTLFVAQMFGAPKLAVVTPTQQPVQNTTALVTPVTVTPVQEVTPIRVAVVSEHATEKEQFVSVRNASVQAASVVSIPQPESRTESSPAAPWYAKFVFNPALLAQYAFSLIMAVTIIAIALLIGIEASRRHPKDVVFGCALFALVLGLLVWNSQLLA
ncbi:MAG TPA: CAP domain-containing protein [Candidatus Paceibacterota bacterium]|nr:CAP domain-containing protein [Candidatus Paceibacterota bacterium]